MNEIPHDNPRKNQVDRLLRVLGKVMHNIKPGAHCGGILGELHITQRIALMHIKDQPGITQRDIAEKIGVTAAAISPAMRRMVKMGLVERSPDPEDARSLQLFLTPHALELVDEMLYERRAMMSQLASRLSDEDLQTLVGLLEQMTEFEPEHL